MLQSLGHLKRIKKNAWLGKCRSFKISGNWPEIGVVIGFKFGGNWPGKTWNELIRSDLKEKKANRDIAKEKNTWKFFIRNRPTHASMGKNLIIMLFLL